MVNLTDLLKLLPVVGPVVASAPEFKKIYDQLVGTLDPTDQPAAKAAYAEVIKQSDAIFARVDEKLKGAE